MIGKRHLYLGVLALAGFAGPAWAEDPWVLKEPPAQPAAAQTSPAMQAAQPSMEMTDPASAALDPMSGEIAALQQEWAHIKYQVSDKEQQLESIHKLESQAAAVSTKYPDKAEPKIWEGIILSTEAGIVKGLSALGKVEKAKELFEISMNIDPQALNGSAYTSLGSLYYQVPGWPVGFGDDEKAEEHLKKALQINPAGIDPNFFYGDFLLQDGRYDEARTYLERALQAPDRPGRELADAGRRQEIRAALAQIDQKRKDKGQSQYN